MKFNRGDVVLIDYPSTDAGGIKARPALVVQDDRRNALLPTTIVALITNDLSRVLTDPTQVLIDLNTPDGHASGLSRNSAVECRRLSTIPEELIRGKIGVLSAPLMQQITNCLKTALDLS